MRTCAEKPYMAAIVTTRQSSGRGSRGTPKHAPGGSAGGSQQATAMWLAAHSLTDARLQGAGGARSDSPAGRMQRDHVMMTRLG